MVECTTFAVAWTLEYPIKQEITNHPGIPILASESSTHALPTRYEQALVGKGEGDLLFLARYPGDSRDKYVA